jgi:hypothetical protein
VASVGRSGPAVEFQHFSARRGGTRPCCRHVAGRGGAGGRELTSSSRGRREAGPPSPCEASNIGEPAAGSGRRLLLIRNMRDGNFEHLRQVIAHRTRSRGDHRDRVFRTRTFSSLLHRLMGRGTGSA